MLVRPPGAIALAEHECPRGLEDGVICDVESPIRIHLERVRSDMDIPLSE